MCVLGVCVFITGVFLLELIMLCEEGESRLGFFLGAVLEFRFNRYSSPDLRLCSEIAMSLA